MLGASAERGGVRPMSTCSGSALDEQPAERLDVSEACGGEPPRVQRSFRTASMATSTSTSTSTGTGTGTGPSSPSAASSPSTGSSAPLDDGIHAARAEHLLRRPQ